MYAPIHAHAADMAVDKAVELDVGPAAEQIANKPAPKRAMTKAAARALRFEGVLKRLPGSSPLRGLLSRVLELGLKNLPSSMRSFVNFCANSLQVLDRELSTSLYRLIELSRPDGSTAAGARPHPLFAAMCVP